MISLLFFFKIIQRSSHAILSMVQSISSLEIRMLRKNILCCYRQLFSIDYFLIETQHTYMLETIRSERIRTIKVRALFRLFRISANHTRGHPSGLSRKWYYLFGFSIFATNSCRNDVTSDSIIGIDNCIRHLLEDISGKMSDKITRRSSGYDKQ